MKKTRITATDKVKVSINMPERLLVELDEHRATINQDRSVWITSAIMEKLSNIKLKKQKDEE